MPPTRAVAGGLGRRRFMALGGAAVVSAMAVTVTAGCGSNDNNGLLTLFGSRIAAVRAVGVSVLDGGPLSAADPDQVVVMLPAEGVDMSVSGPGLVISVQDPETFSAALAEQSAAEMAAGSLQLVAGYPLTPTEMALAAAVVLSTS